MKLHEHHQAHMQLIGRYGPGLLQINGREYTAPCMVAPGFLKEDWITGIAALDATALEPMWPLQPRIVLLGASTLPPDRLRPVRAALAAHQIALEPMDLGAACRTYNVLAQEDRAVVALLFPGDPPGT